MERATKTFKTESGKEVEVKEYLTGPENNQLKAALFDGITVGTEKDMDRMPLSNTFKREEKLLEMAVVSFDGNKENVLERINELPSYEYDALLKQIGEELKLNFQKAT